MERVTTMQRPTTTWRATTEQRAVGENAGDHAVLCGLRRVVYLRQFRPESNMAADVGPDEVLIGLVKALSRTTNPRRPELVVVEVGADSRRAGRRSVEEILLYAPDTVLCATDSLASGVLDGFRAIGVAIPEDIDVQVLAAA